MTIHLRRDVDESGPRVRHVRAVLTGLSGVWEAVLVDPLSPLVVPRFVWAAGPQSQAHPLT
jgi:hypothetical protein